MMVPTLRSARLAGLTLSAALVFACGGEEPAPPDPSKAPAATKPSKPKTEPPRQQITLPKDFKVEPDSVRIERQSGEVFEAKILGDVALPEGFPDDVPLYPSAKIIVALTVPGGGVMASFETTAGLYCLPPFASDRSAHQPIVRDEESIRGEGGAEGADVGVGGEPNVVARLECKVVGGLARG